MRIVVVVNLYPSPPTTTGDIVMTELRVEGLRKKGHDVCVLTSEHSPPTSDLHARQTLEVVTSTHRLNLLQKTVARATHFLGARLRNQARMAALLQEFQPDVVDVSGISGVSAFTVLPVLRRGVPMLVSLQDETYLNAIALHSSHMRRLMSLFGKTDPEMLRLCNSVASSRYIRTRYIQAGFEPGRIGHIPYGVRLAPARREIKKGGPLNLLYLGRFVPEKGVGTLLEAMQIVRSVLGDRAPHLRMVGYTPLNGGLDVEGEIKLKGLEGSVKVSPPVLPESVTQVLRAHDVLVVPSNWPEPFGLVTLEAMAHGLPVIVTNVGGLAELIDDGVEGWMVEGGNAEALAQAIILAESDRDRLCQMGSRCLDRCRKDYSANVYLDRMERALQACATDEFERYLQAQEV